ncbi:PPP family 3-phenylpropionic acid transporter [Bacillus fengqiuensis]|nr:PPP family 3-phenylpropionic acid transporter [Bacillus fengqiuensis]
MHKHAVLYLSVFLFFFHSSVTIMSNFLPLYFQEHGLSATKIGWLMAIGPFTALFSQPFWGYMSDKYKTVKRMVLICLIGMTISSVILFQMNSFFALIFLCGLFYSFMSPVGALGDSLAQKTSSVLGTAFGRIRMWGSVGFAATSLIGGALLARIGLDYLLYLFLVYALVTLVLIRKVSDVNVSSKPIYLKDAVRVIVQPRFLFFLFFIMFVSITHRANDSFAGLYIKELGGSESLIGLAWFVAVAAEAAVFLLSPYWMRFFNEMTYLVIAAGLYGVRWLLLSLAETPSHVILLQSMHGMTFGVFYLCAFQFVTKLIPDEFRATGQLVFISAFFGLSGIIGSLGGGFILDFAGGAALYQLLSYCALAGCIGLIVYKTYLNKKEMSQVQSLQEKSV